MARRLGVLNIHHYREERGMKAYTTKTKLNSHLHSITKDDEEENMAIDES
jgi:hypothetical protein